MSTLTTTLSPAIGQPSQRARWKVSPSPVRWRRWPAQPQAAPTVDYRGVGTLSKSLRDKTVGVLGLGAVGGVVFRQLARLGVGRLIGVDPDDYGALSWLTQPCRAADAGRPKAWVQGALAWELNPTVDVRTGIGWAQDVSLSRLNDCDLIVIAGDNLELVVWATHVAAGLGKPLIQGAVHGESQSAIVRVYDFADAAAACPLCAFTDSHWNSLRQRVGCDGIPGRPSGEATRTLPTVCETAAQMTTTEVIKRLTGPSERPLAGEEVVYSLAGHRAWRTQLPRGVACRGSHRRWTVVNCDRSPSEMTLGDATRYCVNVGDETAPWRKVQTRGELPWTSSACCSGCGQSTVVRRFARRGAKVGRCECGTVLVATQPGQRGVIPTDDVHAVWNKPLSDIGLRAGDTLRLSWDDDEWLLKWGGKIFDSFFTS